MTNCKCNNLTIHLAISVPTNTKGTYQEITLLTLKIMTVVVVHVVVRRFNPLTLQTIDT